MAAMTTAMTIASTTATTTPATRPAFASPSPCPLLVGTMDIDITVLVVRGLFASRHTSLPAIPPDVDNIEVVIATMVVVMVPYAIKSVSDYSLPDALDNRDGDETREGEDEEGGSGGSDVALGQHSTAARHYTLTQRKI